jgi:hypothetical protein
MSNIVKSKRTGIKKYVLPSDYGKGIDSDAKKGDLDTLGRLLGEDILSDTAKRFIMKRVIRCLWDMEYRQIDSFLYDPGLGGFMSPKFLAMIALGLYEELDFDYKDLFLGLYNFEPTDFVARDLFEASLMRDDQIEVYFPELIKTILTIAIVMNANYPIQYKPMKPLSLNQEIPILDLSGKCLWEKDSGMTRLTQLSMQSLFDQWMLGMSHE